jgi:hypothetical protein
MNKLFIKTLIPFLRYLFLVLINFVKEELKNISHCQATDSNITMIVYWLHYYGNIYLHRFLVRD